MNFNYFINHASKLIESGYKIIPLVPNDKKSTEKGWQNLNLTIDDLPTFLQLKDRSNSGVGVLAKYTPAIDIDIKDESIVASVINLIDEFFRENATADYKILTRIGNAPKLLIPCQTDKPFKKILSNSLKSDSGLQRVEILGDGQQWVAYGVHPDTKKPYLWEETAINVTPFAETPEELLTTNHNELPYLDETLATELVIRINMLLSEYVSDEQTLDVVAVQKTSNKTVSNSFELTENTSIPKHDIDVKYMKNVLKSYDVESYEDWFKAIGAIKFQAVFKDEESEGLELAIAWSKTQPNFKSAVDVAKQWNECKHNGDNLFTFTSIIQKVNEVKRADKLAKDEQAKIEVAKLLNSDDVDSAETVLEYMLENLVLIGGDEIRDLNNSPSSVGWSKDKFENVYKNKKYPKVTARAIVEVPISKLWFEDSKRKTLHRKEYAPGQDRIFINDCNYNGAKELVFNTFYFPNHTNKRCDISIFFEFMNYLLPSDTERNWFLAWMAFTIQKPQMRCPVSPLIISSYQGVGKSTVGAIMGALVGMHNMSKTKIDMLDGSKSSFNGFLKNCKIVVCDEVASIHAKDKRDVVERLKETLTEEYLLLNAKYEQESLTKIYANFLFLSNNADALALRASDRRFNVFECPNPPQNSEFYDNLRAFINNPVAIATLFEYLLNLDISSVNFNVPIETPALLEMIEYSEDTPTSAYNELVKSGEYCGLSLAQTLHAVNNIITQKGILDNQSEYASYSKIKAILQRSCRRSAQQLRVDSERPRVWDFGTSSQEELKESYRRYKAEFNVI